MAGRSNKSKNKGKGGINSKNATQNNPMVDVEPASNDISLGKEQIVDHAGQNSDVSMDPNSFVNGPEHTEKDSPHNHLHISENGNEIDSSSTVKHVNVVSGELHLYPVTVKGPCGEKLELQVAETRFASHTIVMRRLLKVKDALSQMVIGHQWGVWKISNLERAQRIRDLILNESWWARVAYVLDFTEPIMTMLRFADTDTPCLGDVYDGMDTMVEKVKHSIQAHESDPTQCEALCKQVQAIINHRWNKMTTPLHLLAYALSHRYYSEEIAGMPGRVAPFADEEVAEGCYKALSRLFPLEEMHEKVREEFGLFASGLKHSPFALKDQNRMGAITWWYMYGQPFKHLQPLAIKVLSQINPGDSVMDLRQFLLDAPETCFYTCYDLIMVMKDGSRHQLADYFEIGDIGDITTGGCSLEMVTALYDDRSVRSHVHRVRDLISTFTLHSSLSTSFAMEYEATRSSSGGDKKSEVPELEGLGFMEDPNGLLENLVVSPSSQEIKCVESIAFSSFNPAPGYRRLLGDLIYLDVVTLEGQSYCITAHTRGYYINASTGDILDPWPAKSAHEATSLVGLLRQSSNKFKKGFREVLERKASCHPFENVPSLLPLHSWLGISPPPAHRRDVSRAEDALALPYGTESIGMQRDWNEELQSCREFPRKTIQDRILRDRALYKVSCDFVDAAIKGAKGVISRCIPPINPTDPERFHMYVHNNIFFSFAVDADFTQMQQSYEQKTSLDNASALANDEGNRCDALADHKDVNNVETPKGEALLNQNISDVILNEVKEPESEKTEVEVLVPKEETDPDAGLLENDTSQLIDSEQATYASANNDLKGTKAYNNADISGLYTLAMAIVDYRGHRVVAQSIIPGILQGDKSDSLLYGSVDNGKKICWNDKFHEKVLEAAKVLHIKEHEVLDGSGNRVKMAAPVECKGIVGSDDRHYLLDLMRTTPRDANYMGPGSRYCVLRPELVASFCQVESQERAKKNNEKDATNGSALQEDVPAVLLNPNILTDFKLAGDSKEVASDESLVKKAGAYLLDVVLPKFVQDLSSLEVSPMDGQTLTEALHAHGINVRYFGKVANMAKLLPHIVDLCIVEMVVRAAKHVLKGVLRETQDHDLGGAIAHFFNCFLGHDAPPCTKAGSPAGDKPRKKGKVAHSKKGANQLPSTADNTSKSIVEACKNHSKTLLQSKSSGQIQSSYLCITSELVWIDIKECVKFKYQFELPEDVKKRVKKMSTFRNLCQKVGITIGARKYDLDSETPFNISDILDMHTVVKHSATVCSDARDLIETGKLQLAEGKLNEAYELFHEAFSILQQVSGPMHREVANCCRYLAMVLYHAGDMAGAIMQQHKELIINERCLGLDHPDTAHSYGNMALFYHGLNQTELALRHMARTLLLLNVSCGPDHPDVAATFINIAMMYQDIGRMNIALRYLQEALKKNERLLGHDHIQTAVCYHALAIAFNCMGAYKLSLQHERSTYNILAKQLGEDDSRTRDSANWIKTFQIRDVQINAQKQKGQAVDLDATQKAVDALKARPDLIQAFQAATGGPTGSRSRTSLNKAATAVLMSDTLPRGRGMDERGARAAAEVRKKAVARGLNVRPQGVPAQSLPQFTELLNIINSSMASKAPPGDSPSTSSQEAGKESSTNSENEIRTAEVCVEETRENVPEENSEDKTPLGLGTGLTSFENKKQKSKPKDSSD